MVVVGGSVCGVVKRVDGTGNSDAVIVPALVPVGSGGCGAVVVTDSASGVVMRANGTCDSEAVTVWI
jgi:hypothetical protein